MFQGMIYAGEHIAIVEKLAQESIKLVKEIGIYTVKYLSIWISCLLSLFSYHVQSNRYQNHRN